MMHYDANKVLFISDPPPPPPTHTFIHTYITFSHLKVILLFWLSLQTFARTSIE